MSGPARSWRRAAQRLVLHRGAWIANALIVAAAAIGFIAVALGRRPQFWWFASFLIALCTIAAGSFWMRWMRERVIRESPLPQFLKRKLREVHPQLSGRDTDLVERAFRQFFIACARSGTRFVAMPSRAVDAYWHEFILHTRAYCDWCELTLGRFLHHTPSEALGAAAVGNDGLRRAWFWSCREESIDPRRASRLPLLFAIDAKLKIADGFVYLADCRMPTAVGAEPGHVGAPTAYCAADMTAPSFSGDAEGLGGADPPTRTDSGDGGSSGCGGSGCAGGDGCGGGGD